MQWVRQTLALSLLSFYVRVRGGNMQCLLDLKSGDSDFKSRPRARFSKVPAENFQARKCIRKTPSCLFCKAGLFICCKGNRNKITAKFRVSRRLRFNDTKGIRSPGMRPKSFRTFEKRAPYH